MPSNKLNTFFGVLIVASLVGCGGAQQTESDRFGPRSRAGQTLVEVSQTDVPLRCEVATLYFEYDSDRLTDAARDELSRAATCLRHGQSLPISLIGAADPRGTEEYNLALGERRARSVYTYFTRLGVDPNVVTFTSAGEEMARGSNDASWALDRHVESHVREIARGLAEPTVSVR